MARTSRGVVCIEPNGLGARCLCTNFGNLYFEQFFPISVTDGHEKQFQGLLTAIKFLYLSIWIDSKVVCMDSSVVCTDNSD